VGVGTRVLGILQNELDTRLKNPERLRSSEIASLLRAACATVEVGMRMMLESIEINTVLYLDEDEE
jgi:hypothetical protein